MLVWFAGLVLLRLSAAAVHELRPAGTDRRTSVSVACRHDDTGHNADDSLRGLFVRLPRLLHQPCLSQCMFINMHYDTLPLILCDVNDVVIYEAISTVVHFSVCSKCPPPAFTQLEVFSESSIWLC